MTNAIRSEFRKYFTTRMWWGMAITMFLAGALASGFFAFIFTNLMTPAEAEAQGFTLDPTQTANTVYTAGLSMGAYILTLTIGVLAIGAEYRHQTITSTFLTTPSRIRAMLAKTIAVIVIAMLNGLVLLAGAVGAGASLMAAFGADPFPDNSVFRSLAMLLLVLVVWALIGLGVGILIPNQVAALLIAIGIAYMIEPLLVVGMMFWDWGAQYILPYLPTQATSAVVNNINFFARPDADRLEWWAAALVLLAYAVILAGIGLWRSSREDVS